MTIPEVEQPKGFRPFVTWTLIVANAIFFLLQHTVPGFTENLWFYGPLIVERGLYPFITSAFLHGSIEHIVGNMLFLLTFGPKIEERFGRVLYFLSYLAIAFGSSLFWLGFFYYIAFSTPALGASGAISGVMGAFWNVFPAATIKAGGKKFKAFYYFGAWVLLQFVFGVWQLAQGNAGGVGYWIHLFGFGIGAIIASRARRGKKWKKLAFGWIDYRLERLDPTSFFEALGHHLSPF